MKEYYVSYETAQLLKEKGFDWGCRAFMFEDDSEIKLGVNSHTYEDFETKHFKHLILLPTQQMACSWFRDKQIDILPDCSLVDRKYSFHIINRYKSGGEIIHSDEMYDKYEDAIEAALEYCLTNLI